MCRPVLTGMLLCQLDFIWRGTIGVDREIAVIYAVAFSAADHSCAEADEKNRLHRVSGRLYKVGFIWVGPMTASSSRHWLDAILPYFIPDMESIKTRRNGLGFRSGGKPGQKRRLKRDSGQDPSRTRSGGAGFKKRKERRPIAFSTLDSCRGTSLRTLREKGRTKLALAAVDQALLADPTDLPAQRLRLRVLDALPR